MDCPRCDSKLEITKIEGEDIEFCNSCKGMWLHKDQLNNLISESNGNVEISSVDYNRHKDLKSTIKCRDCENSTMIKINFLEYSDIIMDYCEECGAFWLDYGELHKIHIYMEKIENGSHEVKNKSIHHFLTELSSIAYNVFH